MAQYGGDQEYGRDNVHRTDEYGNPVRRTDEYETVVQSAAGERYERDVRHVDEFGNTIHITEEYGINPGRTGTGTGTHGTAGHQGLGTNIRQVTGGTGTDYTSGGRSAAAGQTGSLGGRTMGDYGFTHQTGTDTYGSTGHQGLGAKIGKAIGGADYSSGGIMHGHHQELGQATKGVGAGTYTGDRTTGHQGLGTERDTTLGGIMHADHGHHQGLGQATKGVGAGTYTGDRSTGHQGLGTERDTTLSSGIMHADRGYHQGLDQATKGVGGGIYGTGTGIGTGHQGIGTEVGSGGTAVSSTKVHTATPLGGAGIGTGSKDVYPHGSTGMEEKKGVMQKIKEKLPGGHTADEQQTATTAAGHGYGDTHEKKGMMEKIKEKLPGHH